MFVVQPVIVIYSESLVQQFLFWVQWRCIEARCGLARVSIVVWFRCTMSEGTVMGLSFIHGFSLNRCYGPVRL